MLQFTCFLIHSCNIDLNGSHHIFLLHEFMRWEFRNGVKQRRTTWQDGVLGTNCPIPPNSNWTYKFQMKDQIGTFNYFPSTKVHRAFGGFGAINIAQRSVISVPYHIPDAEFTLLVSDWFKNFSSHKVRESSHQERES